LFARRVVSCIIDPMSHTADYITLIILCTIVILSHFFEAVSRRLRVPSVLLLLATGFLLKAATGYFGIDLHLQRYVTILGVIGLIMIVLEGTINIKLERHNRATLASGFLLAFVTLVVSTIGVFFLLAAWLPGRSPHTLIVNAIPLAVVSSAIAIPAVHHLAPRLKEFITYESAFSDILGITIFNILVMESMTPRALMTLSLLNTFGVAAFSLAGTLVLLIIIRRLVTKVKFTFVLAILILLYSAGKIFHVSVLFLVFIFGLMMNNTELYAHWKFFHTLGLPGIEKDIGKFKLFIGESTFLVRTFFFILFGFTMDVTGLFRMETVLIGSGVIAIILLTRRLFFKVLHKDIALSALFIAPRGLVTILLFYSIPAVMRTSCLEHGVLLFVIVTTNLLMMGGVFLQPDTPIQNL